ncbi:myelin protein zero-like protein 1 isoform X2 [Hemicordylus capensis]|uniref:myelin protein zero-like protein 1 isoform X2 n=1 Tax=Hemicordylus capensis TaxID=884348 RepID=UPI002304B33B|nr:myelin protein zero-like protein 1 isoform X2 [Hemicordylus capensis]
MDKASLQSASSISNTGRSLAKRRRGFQEVCVIDSSSAQYPAGDSLCFPRPSPTMGGGGTMGSKGGGGRKMATAVLTAAGGGSPRQRAASAARLPALLLAAALSLFQVSAVEVYTPPELSVENGTEAKLSCTFKSSEVISSAASVTWSFQAEGSTTTVSFFYYSNGKAYPGKDVPFKDRISWAGDLNKKDASINIANMRFLDNGTYICDVKNPPDIVVTPGEIKLRVVERGNLPAFPIVYVAMIAIGGVLGLVFLIAVVVCVVCRKKNSKKHYSGCSTSESLVSPVKQAPRKSPSDTEGLVNSVPIRSHQSTLEGEARTRLGRQD